MSTSPPVVLIVADPGESLAMYAISLLAMGFQPVTAADADEAFARACHVHPDMIVTEISHACLAGVPFIRRVRQDIRTSAARIIVIGDADAAERRECGLLCDEYVVKPCPPQELCVRISGLLSRPDAAWHARHH